MLKLRWFSLPVVLFPLIVNAQEGSGGPGTVNFTEGQVAVDGHAVNTATSTDIEIAPGQVLETTQGRAEILLTPGVFVRIGENSAIKMDEVSRNVRLEVVHGEALVEVDQVDPSHRLEIVDQGADTRLDRKGLYLFDATNPAIAVYSGATRVDDDRRVVSLKQGEQLPLNGDGPPKPRRFDAAENVPLYQWSARRADADAQVAEWTTEELQVIGDQSAYQPGWHWSPWYHSWAFVPAKGYVRSAFNYGFYAPATPHNRTPVFGDFR